jgi:hypothetical protein
MVDTRELTPGMSMEFPPVPLRLALTGVTDDVRVHTVGPGSVAVGGRRVSDTELIVLPIEGAYRVEAVPTVGVAFPAGSRLGIDVTTDSATVESRQGFLQPTDVGALRSIELVTVTFREGGWVVTVAPTARQPGARRVSLAKNGQHPQPAAQIDDRTHRWVGPGRFAYRSAVSNGARMRSAGDRSWGIVLDSSASMWSTFRPSELEHLVNLVAGIFGEWTGRAPAAAYVTGRTEPHRVAQPDPTALAAASSDAAQLASWSIVTPAIRASAGITGGLGAVVVVTDGVPGDVADLSALAQDEPMLDLFLVTTGISRFGLVPDTRGRESWEEELSGLESVAALPNVRIAALAIGRGLDLDDGRSAELASALLGEEA